ncbi:sialate O-acetylesterase [Pontibacter akesuensis]|uniref:Sialate O-acetylesterase n=2 Tax=Pontibacter akesuensis TaxID=388950 RepID=A0A1I7HS70_9BACT|nr:9-O-acetylesterase [Pontibacter akesuensis]SFU63595.1 sialate O-acetylesterase [Pontibacter akesuensis]
MLSFLLPLVAQGQVRLPKLISDGMVLQRDTDLKVWGWASAGEKVSVRFLNKTYQAVADNKGAWEVQLAKLKAGGPHQMVITGKNAITLQDILVGDVWVCSGQSNMELPMRRVKPLYAEEMRTAQNEFIRYFEVPKTYDFNVARQDLEAGSWQKVTPATIPNFGAVGYFFAKDLYAKYKVPIGLINSALGGSPVEAWLSEEALKQFPEHYQEAQLFKDQNYIKKIEGEDQARIQAWYRELFRKDKGYQGRLHWSDPALNTADWAGMEIPGYWADTGLGPVNGVVWFRKEIEVPASMAGQPADLNLGAIVDSDSAFVNGQFVGTTGYQYPPRWYTVPAGVLKAGKNTLAIRIVNESGRGGFVPDKPYELVAGNKKIDLKGKWQYKLGAAMDPLKSQTFIRWKPLGLYNAMIAPLIKYNIKGVIWYQGESNADTWEEYESSFPAMIKDWRNKWGQGDFPFLYVQLANYMEAKSQPSESDWAQLREAQRKALALPNSAMAVAIDVGEWNDIHPLNKKAVGERLALAAQKVAYGDEVVYSGPMYQSVKRKGNKLILTFANTGSGLEARGGELKQFAIASPDKKYVWAKARIEGNKVVVWSDTVSKPVAVRYAWADNPEGANLYNKEGLPASPFQAELEK